MGRPKKEDVETTPVDTREHGVVVDGEVLPAQEQPLKQDALGRQEGAEPLVNSDERADATPVEVREKAAELKEEKHHKNKHDGLKIGNTTFHL